MGVNCKYQLKASGVRVGLLHTAPIKRIDDCRSLILTSTVALNRNLARSKIGQICPEHAICFTHTDVEAATGQVVAGFILAAAQ